MAVSGIKVVEESRRIRSREITASTAATRVDTSANKKTGVRMDGTFWNKKKYVQSIIIVHK